MLWKSILYDCLKNICSSVANNTLKIFGTFQFPPPKIDLYIAPVLLNIFYFCKKILNNILVEDYVFNFEEAIFTGCTTKIPSVKCGFCIENSFLHKCSSGFSTKSARHLGNFYSAPNRINSFKIWHTIYNKCIIQYFFTELKYFEENQRYKM